MKQKEPKANLWHLTTSKHFPRNTGLAPISHTSALTSVYGTHVSHMVVGTYLVEQESDKGWFKGIEEKGEGGEKKQVFNLKSTTTFEKTEKAIILEDLFWENFSQEGERDDMKG
ncbi:hypothetical protein LOAG_08014 [Loa loa]|uniref:Uncharacterized protein n=1 Tax=Loa loa TaxID=7209 RepID=A0A1S0TUL1_LOALO|nr:hypothetical protein LOAG_08014 [Loa loa]EFO20476.1 hypothetical protein LOAG_08014 [Loa loa]